jgi:DNA-binding NarL/FixJ family response regulator
MEGSLIQANGLIEAILGTAEEKVWVETAVSKFDRLTPRELEVVNWVKASRTNVGVAHELNVTPYAVQAHLRNIYAKLGLKEAGLPPEGDGQQPHLDKRSLLCKAFLLKNMDLQD